MDTPLTVRQWSSYDARFQLRGADAAPYILPAGYDLTGQIRRQYADRDPTVRFTITPTGEAGWYWLRISPDDTGKLTVARAPKATYVYDVIICRQVDNWRRRLFGGTIAVVPGVTR